MAAAAETGNYPKGEIANPPELRPWLQWIVASFDELKSCRQIGFGACGAIPWDAIRKYAETYGLTECESEDFHELIRHMDLMELKEQHRKAEQEQASGNRR